MNNEINIQILKSIRLIILTLGCFIMAAMFMIGADVIDVLFEIKNAVATEVK